MLTQLIVNGIIAGAIYALMAASFSLIYNIVKFMDLSPGAIFVVGAFSTYALNVTLGLNLILSIFLSLIISGLVSLAINILIYRPLRNKKADSFTLLLASFGVFLAVTALVLLIFGAELKTFNLSMIGSFTLFGAILTSTQLLLIVCSLAMFILLIALTRYTKIGKSMRAVADDSVVASTLGIDVEKTICFSFIISGVLAGLSGVLVAFEQTLDHAMGFGAILKAMTASIVGGVGNIPAALLGGFLIGIVENIGIWFLPSGYKDAIAFVVLIIFLLCRPQGLLGVKTREEVSG